MLMRVMEVHVRLQAAEVHVSSSTGSYLLQAPLTAAEEV